MFISVSMSVMVLKICVFFRSQTVVCYRRAGHHHDRGPHPLLRSLMPVSPPCKNWQWDRWIDRYRKRDMSLLPFFTLRKKLATCQDVILLLSAFNEKTCCCLSAEELNQKNTLVVICISYWCIFPIFGSDGTEWEGVATFWLKTLICLKFSKSRSIEDIFVSIQRLR